MPKQPHACGGELVQRVNGAIGIGDADDGCARLGALERSGGQAAHGKDHVGPGYGLWQGSRDLGAGGDIFSVQDARFKPGPGLNHDLRPEGNKLADGLGRGRNAGFAL